MLPVLLAGLVLGAARAQEEPEAPPAEVATKPPVAITFTPPDLEGGIALGIFDESNTLVRTLRYAAGSSKLRIDTNGYIASWDGRDEAGAACAAGRYSARGYVVGATVAVEGEAFHFNDWMAEDRVPAVGVALRAWPDGVGVELRTAEGPVFAKILPDGALEKTAAPTLSTSPSGSAVETLAPTLSPAPLAWAPGREGSTWLIAQDDGQNVVAQISREGASERGLRVPKGEPQPVEIVASPAEDAILLRETAAGGIERVRCLRRAAKVEEKDGKVVADWEVVFARTRQPCADFGVIDGKLVADGGATVRPDAITVPLVENALHPEKATLLVRARATNPGSALVAPDGITLVEVATTGDWRRFALVGGVAPGEARLYQGDGLVVEEFAVRRLDRIAAFDAGAFLLAPATH